MIVPQDRSTGFALITAIWVSAILSMLTLGLLHSFNTNTEATHVDAMRVKHNMLHLAGLRYAALHLASPRRQVTPTAIPNNDLFLQLDSGLVKINIENEAGRIDLLKAPRHVLTQILAIQGLSQSEANQLATNIQTLLPEQPLVSYRALRKMLMPFPGLYQTLIAHISLHNGQAAVHPMLASEWVLDLLPDLSSIQKQRILRTRKGEVASLISTPINNSLLSNRLSSFYRISTIVELGDSVHTEVVIIRMTNEPAVLYERIATL